MSGRPRTLGEALTGPHNGFGALRLALAVAVVVSHAFSVTTGRVADEPLHRLTGYTLGEHAVNGFFAISGFLVTMSFTTRGWRDYVVARLLRIGPGLVAATLAVAFLLGPILTALPPGAYFASTDLWRFVLRTLTTFKSSAALPGLFTGNPFTFPMGTVWTLKYETLCYAGVLAAGLAGVLARRGAALALAFALFLALIAAGFVGPPPTALRLAFLFAAGAALYLWRDRVPVLPWPSLALLAASLVLSGTELYPALLFAGSALAVITLAFAPALARPSLALRRDLSYGTYLYGWPIQQSLRQLWPGADPLTLLVPSLALTLVMAALSWQLVEAPALALKGRLLRAAPASAPRPATP
ncbi:MAG: acyltransferase [Methylobacteriaceae bacterium]|nr:acyltransferase [Methylobacteriaceae bacterium]